jgi:nicotinamide-nucleotide amidase
MSDQLDFLLPAELVGLARRVIEANRAAGRRIAVAESCTGGLVAAALTETKLLRVSDDVLETFGSVSVATAWAMAQGALAASGADVAVALTGIAGPAGGSDRKPVGTVVFARADRQADPKEVTADTKKFDDNGRGGVRLQAALCALELLLPDAATP